MLSPFTRRTRHRGLQVGPIGIARRPTCCGALCVGFECPPKPGAKGRSHRRSFSLTRWVHLASRAISAVFLHDRPYTNGRTHYIVTRDNLKEDGEGKLANQSANSEGRGKDKR
jgi:hypothetical protein